MVWRAFMSKLQVLRLAVLEAVLFIIYSYKPIALWSKTFRPDEGFMSKLQLTRAY